MDLKIEDGKKNEYRKTITNNRTYYYFTSFTLLISKRTKKHLCFWMN